MKCQHPGCTGSHKNVGPARDRCPASQEKRRACQARYKRTAKGILAEVRDNAKRRGTT